jgi:hypothetical protein
MMLVDLATAKTFLRITDPAFDAEVTMHVEHASDLMLTYLKGQGDPSWTSETAPARVQAATLKLLGHLYEDRDKLEQTHTQTWEAIGLLLARDRDPALA